MNGKIEAERTPGPWRVKSPLPRCSNSQGKVYGPPHPVDGGDYAPIAVFSNHIDAVVAVKAINTHDELLAALETLAEEHTELLQKLNNGTPCTSDALMVAIAVIKNVRETQGHPLHP